MNISELFWNASTQEMKNGYVEKEDSYVCLLCGKEIEKGIIYPNNGIFYEAEKYMRFHIVDFHKSVFEYLIQLDKKITGLTDHQKSLLKLFFQGKNDEKIKQEMGIGSAATIRNHRFVLKEKERQAKVFLTIMELLKEKDSNAPSFLTVHRTAKMVDERYNVTVEEREKILKKYLPEGVDGPLTNFSVKEKQKLVILGEIAKRFKLGQIYNEQEVNEILKPVYHDYVTVRRYLIEYGFMDRKLDGSKYWLK
jgi:hypothetical protein